MTDPPQAPPQGSTEGSPRGASGTGAGERMGVVEPARLLQHQQASSPFAGYGAQPYGTPPYNWPPGPYYWPHGVAMHSFDPAALGNAAGGTPPGQQVPAVPWGPVYPGMHGFPGGYSSVAQPTQSGAPVGWYVAVPSTPVAAQPTTQQRGSASELRTAAGATSTTVSTISVPQAPGPTGTEQAQDPTSIDVLAELAAARQSQLTVEGEVDIALLSLQDVVPRQARPIGAAGAGSAAAPEEVSPRVSAGAQHTAWADMTDSSSPAPSEPMPELEPNVPFGNSLGGSGGSSAQSPRSSSSPTSGTGGQPPGVAEPSASASPLPGRNADAAFTDGQVAQHLAEISQVVAGLSVTLRSLAQQVAELAAMLSGSSSSPAGASSSHAGPSSGGTHPAKRNPFFDFHRYGLHSQAELDARVQGGYCLFCGSPATHSVTTCGLFKKWRQQQRQRRANTHPSA